MAGVFVSYRREDSAGWSGRIYDRLRDYFGDQRVFMDVDNIPLGEDFTAVISQTLEQVDAVVVVIGPNWLRAMDADQRRRLDDPDDYVRREVAAALQRDITVLPVLVNGAQMPADRALPEDLQPLTVRNAVVISDLRFDDDVARLRVALERTIESEPVDGESAGDEVVDSGTKLCPYCAESIKTKAVLCKHCGSRLDEAPSSAESLDSEVSTTATVTVWTADQTAAEPERAAEGLAGKGSREQPAPQGTENIDGPVQEAEASGPQVDGPQAPIPPDGDAKAQPTALPVQDTSSPASEVQTSLSVDLNATAGEDVGNDAADAISADGQAAVDPPGSRLSSWVVFAAIACVVVLVVALGVVRPWASGTDSPSGRMSVPALLGLSIERAEELAVEAGYETSVVGTKALPCADPQDGKVVYQYPEAGSPTTGGTILLTLGAAACDAAPEATGDG